MEPIWHHLTGTLKALPETYGTYLLRHKPTGKVYVGSTDNLRKRLTNWSHAIRTHRATYKPPASVLHLLVDQGRNVDDWQYKVVSTDRPAVFTRNAKPHNRPEYNIILMMQAQMPALLLNTPFDKVRRKPLTNPQYPWGPRGVSPLRYLGIKLGVQPGPRYDKQPPHERRIDARRLKAASSTAVPFALYLYRSMQFSNPRNMNPSPAAIQELYAEWLTEQPLGYPPKHEARTIHSVQEALDLPDPTAPI